MLDQGRVNLAINTASENSGESYYRQAHQCFVVYGARNIRKFCSFETIPLYSKDSHYLNPIYNLNTIIRLCVFELPTYTRSETFANLCKYGLKAQFPTRHGSRVRKAGGQDYGFALTPGTVSLTGQLTWSIRNPFSMPTFLSTCSL